MSQGWGINRGIRSVYLWNSSPVRADCLPVCSPQLGGQSNLYTGKLAGRIPLCLRVAVNVSARISGHICQALGGGDARTVKTMQFCCVLSEGNFSNLKYCCDTASKHKHRDFASDQALIQPTLFLPSCFWENFSFPKLERVAEFGRAWHP